MNHKFNRSFSNRNAYNPFQSPVQHRPPLQSSPRYYFNPPNLTTTPPPSMQQNCFSQRSSDINSWAVRCPSFHNGPNMSSQNNLNAQNTGLWPNTNFNALNRPSSASNFLNTPAPLPVAVHMQDASDLRQPPPLFRQLPPPSPITVPPPSPTPQLSHRTPPPVSIAEPPPSIVPQIGPPPLRTESRAHPPPVSILSHPPPLPITQPPPSVPLQTTASAPSSVPITQLPSAFAISQQCPPSPYLRQPQFTVPPPSLDQSGKAFGRSSNVGCERDPRLRQGPAQQSSTALLRPPPSHNTGYNHNPQNICVHSQKNGQSPLFGTPPPGFSR